VLGGTYWGCCRFGFEGDVDGCVSGKSWLLLLLLDVDVVCVCVCVCVCVLKGAMTSCLEGSVRLDQERFRTRDGCESGGNEWDGDTYAETRLTFWEL